MLPKKAIIVFPDAFVLLLKFKNRLFHYIFLCNNSKLVVKIQHKIMYIGEALNIVKIFKVKINLKVALQFSFI